MLVISFVVIFVVNNELQHNKGNENVKLVITVGGCCMVTIIVSCIIRDKTIVMDIQ